MLSPHVFHNAVACKSYANNVIEIDRESERTNFTSLPLPSRLTAPSFIPMFRLSFSVGDRRSHHYK